MSLQTTSSHASNKLAALIAVCREEGSWGPWAVEVDEKDNVTLVDGEGRMRASFGVGDAAQDDAALCAWLISMAPALSALIEASTDA